MNTPPNKLGTQTDKMDTIKSEIGMMLKEEGISGHTLKLLNEAWENLNDILYHIWFELEQKEQGK